ncbi:MAG: glycosyltransferase family 2 protein [Flavobacteriaceae bacterium]
MISKSHDLAIIIINYNSSQFTINCVDSVLRHTASSLDYQIVIVDNASEYEDFEKLKSAVLQLGNPVISLHRSRFNTGFGGGNMHGVQFTNAEYYLFLNNDTLMIDNPIKSCFEFMEQTQDAAVCGPKMCNEHHEKKLGFDYFTSFAREVFGKRFVEVVFGKPNRRKDYDTPIPVDYVNGSFMFFRANDFNAVGGFDTNLFLYFEESDICYRLKKKNRKTYYLSNASYIHFQGQSIKKTKRPMAIKIELKTAMFYVIRKNYGYLHYQLLRLVFIVRYGLATLVKPSYFPLFFRILIGLPLGKSLKQTQVIKEQ